jgi:hypothetical protein
MLHHRPLMRLHLLSLALLLLSLTTADARPWKDITGRKVEVTEWRVEGFAVVFVINGKSTPVPLDQLCAEDQAFAKQWARDHPKPTAQDPAAAPAAAKTPPQGTAPATAAKTTPMRPSKLENGDVILDHLPSPAVEEEVRQWLPLTSLLVIAKHYQWSIDVIDLAKKNGWKPDNQLWDERPFFFAAGRETHSKVTESQKFDFEDLVQLINKGRPLLIWRGWSEARDDKFIAFEKEHRANPEAKLPNPRDPEEKKKWITDHSNSSAITTLIIGYNRARGEVLLQLPMWGEDYQCFRMRKEEMEATGYAFWSFEPK